MSSLGLSRPRSLCEVASDAQSYREFGMNLRDFLHEFAFAKEQVRPLESSLAKEPLRLAAVFENGKICDAFLAATADYLSRTNGIQTPAWALSEDRVLDTPWFSLEDPEIRFCLLRDSPSAFKDKNIFTFESSMNVA